ncbi:MAG: shikimate dehydrogenase [Hyphococcus sp.]
MAAADRKKTPILAGVVGWPVEHSLSPLIHTIWARRAGVDGHYIPLAIAPAYDDFAKAMDSLRTIGFAGVNVTLPHKDHALRYAQRASAIAQQAGAANMLTFDDAGAHADNSDVAGFAAALAGARRDGTAPANAVVLGAGGAARGVALALQAAGATRILVANRTRAKAEAVASDIGGDAVDWPARHDALAGADILVNATSLGMRGQPPLEIDLSALSPKALVADIVYSPLETALLKSAREQGRPTIDGLDMLMHQAAPGFREWFGADAVVDAALRAGLVRELERRSRP